MRLGARCCVRQLSGPKSRGLAVIMCTLVACGADPNGVPDVTSQTDAEDVDGAGDLADVSLDAATASDGTPNEVIGNDVADGGGGVQYPTCAQVIDCVEAKCTASPTPDCQSSCLSGGDAGAATKAQALLTCAQSKCALGQCKGRVTAECMKECTSGACLPEVLTCVDGPTTGNQPCGSLKACFDKCTGPGGFVCEAGCMAAITTEAKKQAFDFATCLAGPAAQGNLLGGCLPQITACFDNEKKGQKACFEALDSLGGCGDGSDGFQCIVDLLKTLTPAAQTALGDLLPCLGQDITPTAACTDKTMACIAPTGADSCDKSLLCAMGCAKKSGGADPGPGCVYACLHTGTIAGGKTLLSFLGCDPAKDPACADGLLQCVAPSGSDTCAGVLACASACPKVGSEPDTACTIGCVQAGSLAGAKTALTAISCSGKTDGACKDIQQTCYAPSGTKNCLQLGACIQTCGASPTPGKCQAACYADASVAAFQDFSAWTQCYSTCAKSCGADDACKKTCLPATCPQAYAACTST